GLANVGIDAFVRDKIPFLEEQKTKIIVNVAGSTLQEYIEVCSVLADFERVDMIELNISCPNVQSGGIEFGADPTMTEKMVAEVKRVFPRPIIAKLGPMVTSITAIALAAQQGGADALSIMNSAYGTAIDIETWQPRLTFNRGGLTGPAIKPIALAMVDAVYQKCKLPIIGIGGVTTAEDAVEFFLVGASAVQVGTALFVQPDAPVRIVDGLKEYMKRRKLATIADMVGKVRKW
ncbi:dihydroorotate dehydrogenase, partial [candidate division GN15 bacterium]